MSAVITPIKALKDNYVWLVQDGAEACVVIDPGEAAPVEEVLSGQALTAILLTHHHADHIGGAEALQQRYQVPVYGPKDIAVVDHPLVGGESVQLGELSLRVLATPGHTLDHLVYVLEGDKPALFSGDTLFSAGSGRLFEGTAEQLFKSLRQFDGLADSTLVCPGHEYTEGNLAFVASLGNETEALRVRTQDVKVLRAEGLPSVHVPLGVERKVNPFLMAGSGEELARLRALKDQF